jgi:tetratricopeptide (TPR) repeat protein
MVDLGDGAAPNVIHNLNIASVAKAAWTSNSSAPYKINLGSLATETQEMDSITTNTTWSGVIEIVQDVIIRSGVTLTISPGTMIVPYKGASLVVNGTLSAVGTSSQNITFARRDSSGYWGGIRFNSGSGSSSVQYCTIANATIGISCYSSSPFITYTSLLKDSLYGIYCYSASPTIHHDTIMGSVYALRCDNNSSPLLGVPATPPGPGHNVFTQNTNGIFTSNSSTPLIGSGGGYVAGYNCIHSNTGADFIATSCGSIWAQANWWNGTPKTYLSNTTLYYTPALTSDPNGCNPLGTTIGTFADRKNTVETLSVGSLASATISTVSSSSGSENPDLANLLLLTANGKYSEAAAGYKQKYNDATDVEGKKYLLAQIANCYRKGESSVVTSSGQGLLDYLNDVGKKLSTGDELYAATLELQSRYLIEQGQYETAVEKYKTLRKGFTNNTRINKHALFNLGYLYAQMLGDSATGKIYFDALTTKYPDDELSYLSKFLHGRYTGISLKSKSIENEKDLLAETSLIPTETAIKANYPNPFNPSTVISYQLSVPGNVSLKVYDMLGREVAVLTDGMKEAGYYTATFNGSRLASGVYFVRMKATPQDGTDPFVKTMKMVLTK